MSSPRPEPLPLRIGDAERDEAVAALQEHFAAGRLTDGEFDERVARAIAARTAHDVAVLFTDLPWPRPPLGPVVPPLTQAAGATARAEWRPVTRPTVSPAHAITACVLAVMTGGYLLPWAVAALRNRSDTAQLALVNLLLGWTIVGWIVPLVMACSNEDPPAPAWAPLPPPPTPTPALPRWPRPPGSGDRPQ